MVSHSFQFSPAKDPLVQLSRPPTAYIAILTYSLLNLIYGRYCLVLIQIFQLTATYVLHTTNLIHAVSWRPWSQQLKHQVPLVSHRHPSVCHSQYHQPYSTLQLLSLVEYCTIEMFLVTHKVASMYILTTA